MGKRGTTARRLTPPVRYASLDEKQRKRAENNRQAAHESRQRRAKLIDAMKNHIEMLTESVRDRDAEISRLRSQLADMKTLVATEPTPPPSPLMEIEMMTMEVSLPSFSHLPHEDDLAELGNLLP
jgi:predicted RNase H-like nuclease (RuvC/YqgF family)